MLELYTPSRAARAYSNSHAALMRQIAIVLADQLGVASLPSACPYCGTVWCHCGGDRAKS